MICFNVILPKKLPWLTASIYSIIQTPEGTRFLKKNSNFVTCLLKI